MDLLLRSEVEETLKALLDAEADHLCGAQQEMKERGLKGVQLFGDLVSAFVLVGNPAKFIPKQHGSCVVRFYRRFPFLQHHTICSPLEWLFLTVVLPARTYLLAIVHTEAASRAPDCRR